MKGFPSKKWKPSSIRNSPVGLAWDLALKKDPSRPLYQKGGNHPTTLGAYLPSVYSTPRSMTGVPSVSPTSCLFLNEMALNARRSILANRMPSLCSRFPGRQYKNRMNWCHSGRVRQPHKGGLFWPWCTSQKARRERLLMPGRPIWIRTEQTPLLPNGIWMHVGLDSQQIPTDRGWVDAICHKRSDPAEVQPEATPWRRQVLRSRQRFTRVRSSRWSKGFAM